jgi:hypothetical protein
MELSLKLEIQQQQKLSDNAQKEINRLINRQGALALDRLVRKDYSKDLKSERREGACQVARQIKIVPDREN